MGTHTVLRIILLVFLFIVIARPQPAACLQESSDSATPGDRLAKACLSGKCTSNDGNATAPSERQGADVTNEPADAGMTFKKVFLNLPGDQKAIWTSPFRLRPNDSLWAVPMAGAVGVLIGSDQHSMVRARSNALAISRSDNVANGGVAALVAVPAAMYVWGSWQGKSRARETGLLSGEALINSFGVNEALKVVFARERPTTTNGQGKFFNDVGNASFPSAHSMLGWTAASAIAHDYPGPLTHVLAYGTATAARTSHVTGRHHFPSDVEVGAAAGWLIRHQVYQAHHDPNIDAPADGSSLSGPKEIGPYKLGSPYVPLDS